jgi:hypothetical protein
MKSLNESTFFTSLSLVCYGYRVGVGYRVGIGDNCLNSTVKLCVGDFNSYYYFLLYIMISYFRGYREGLCCDS